MRDDLYRRKQRHATKSLRARINAGEIEFSNLDFTDMKFHDALRILKAHLSKFSRDFFLWTSEKEFLDNKTIGFDINSAIVDFVELKSYFIQKYKIYGQLHAVSYEDSDVTRAWVDSCLKYKSLGYSFDLDFIYDADPNPSNSNYRHYLNALKEQLVDREVKDKKIKTLVLGKIDQQLKKYFSKPK